MRTPFPTISFEASIGEHGDVATAPGAWSWVLKWPRAEELSKWKTKHINKYTWYFKVDVFLLEAWRGVQK